MREVVLDLGRVALRRVDVILFHDLPEKGWLV
jgi:hypothetical protein